MKLRYDAATDSLHIEFAGKPGSDVLPGPAGVSVDVDSNGTVVGITIEHARDIVDLENIEVVGLRGASQTHVKSTIRVNVSTGGNHGVKGDASPLG